MIFDIRIFGRLISKRLLEYSFKTLYLKMTDKSDTHDVSLNLLLCFTSLYGAKLKNTQYNEYCNEAHICIHVQNCTYIKL